MGVWLCIISRKGGFVVRTGEYHDDGKVIAKILPA